MSAFVVPGCIAFLITHIIGVFSLIAGAVSLLTQMLLYIWLEESNSVRITLSLIGLFAVLPFIHLIPRPGRNKRRSIISG